MNREQLDDFCNKMIHEKKVSLSFSVNHGNFIVNYKINKEKINSIFEEIMNNSDFEFRNKPLTEYIETLPKIEKYIPIQKKFEHKWRKK